MNHFSSASSKRELLFLATLEDTTVEEGEEDERWLLFSGEDGDPAKPCVGGSGGFGLGQPY